MVEFPGGRRRRMAMPIASRTSSVFQKQPHTLNNLFRKTGG
jgi:hypothetical protein